MNESSSHCYIQLLCATVDMVNDDDYDHVFDSLLYQFVHLYKILIFSNPKVHFVFQTNGKQTPYEINFQIQTFDGTLWI
jgi:hypothetical protein